MASDWKDLPVAVGCDHAGYQLKLAVLRRLDERGVAWRDYGTDGESSVDYPVYGAKVARAVAGGECGRGIAICGTGIGISIAANKVDGVRAALCADVYSAVMARSHNDANVLALGARVVGEGVALAIVDAWLDTAFQGGRHSGRVRLIHELER